MVSADRADRLAAVALMLLALLLRAHDFGNPGIAIDEEYYLLVGNRMLHGAVPYLDLWDRKPVGLFALFALIRLLPGDGIAAYQLVATLFAGATAWLVWKLARSLGASVAGAAAAGAAYPIWLAFFTGGGGQAPVFYNLFVAAAALLTLRLPRLAGEPGAILRNGALACLLAGLAIQIKYTAAAEGAFFGLAHLWYLRRAGVGRLALAATAMTALGLLPTLLALGCYWRLGPAAFQAFWFANFVSILLRGGYSYPGAVIAGRLAGTIAKLAPFAICAGLGWRFARPEQRRLALGWTAAALVGFAAIGAYFDDYALPLIAPLAALAAPALGRWRVARGLVLGAGLATWFGFLLAHSDDRAALRQAAAAIERESRGGCPYVFTGDTILYHLAHACVPTRYAFPSTLAYAPEAGASGVDEAGEVRRILATRPPVIVTLARPLAQWNERSRAAVAAALTRDYALVLSVRREDNRLLVFALRR